MKNSLKNPKLVFMGTPEFSVPVLNSLISNYQVLAVITQPDKKVGRDQKFTPSPIKKLALEKNIEVLQPEKVKGNQEFLNKIKALKPDLIIIAAYGFILPQELLDIPQFGVINVHASLLPKYRGASPIQSAILNGDKKTGITIMLVNEKMDEGDILAEKEIGIFDNETFTTLHDKLSVLGADLLIETLPKYIAGEIKPQKQDDSQATYCELISKEDGKIDWNKSAGAIERQVRAFNPWPGSWTVWNNRSLKVIKCKVMPRSGIPPMRDKVGEVFKVNEGFFVGCGQDALEILELQLEGKKPMSAKEFLNGYPTIIKSILS